MRFVTLAWRARLSEQYRVLFLPGVVLSGTARSPPQSGGPRVLPEVLSFSLRPIFGATTDPFFQSDLFEFFDKIVRPMRAKKEKIYMPI